jgi:2-amino-4-hydroxy-6-hydroxymethyldihydropteridine diphosphokinase
MSLVRAYLALGSNLGDRLEQMQAALDRLSLDGAITLLQVSPVYENRAVGMGEVDDFLNAIVEVETLLAPLDLLDRCLEVEAQLGRVRTGAWAPRTIDLDVIAYGDEVIEHERLQVPHPRIAERDFVVYPLNAIAPDLCIRGRRVADLAAALPMEGLTLYRFDLQMS